MRDLSVTLVQADLQWEMPAANRTALEVWLDQHACGDLIVLPEMFTTGFSMASSRLAEPMQSDTMQWLQIQAQRQNAAIIGSLIIHEQDCHYNRLLYNRLLCVQPNGQYDYYDKRHLFRLSGEHEHYTAGRDRLIVEVNGWRICPLVCYDLRFPVWSRNRNDYDLLIYIANWPEPRHHAWRTLLTARAIENLAFVVGVNRVGEDGNGLRYQGGSSAVDMYGERLWEAEAKPALHTCTLSAQALQQYRQRFPFYLDADDFDLRLV